MRPVLTPAVRQLWRDPEMLQLGRPSGRCAVVAGVDPPLRAALHLLDGTRDRDQVVASAAALGCSPDRAAALLDLLGETGLLADAGQARTALAALDRRERERLRPDARSLSLLHGDGAAATALELRRAVQVVVRGGSRVGLPIALALAAAGVRTVDVVDDGITGPQDTGVGALDLHDVGRNRGEAARERLARVAPSMRQEPVLRPDLVVLAPIRTGDHDAARPLVLDGVPHLLAEVRDTTGVVGPLVLPGRTACLRCLDLTRSDLDPAWPGLAAQLAAADGAREACDGTLALAVAAQAALQVLALIDGATDPATLGGTLELALPDWRWRRRSWPAHPDCGCAPGG